jgi:hypothetical protein
MGQILAKLLFSVPLVWMLIYLWRSDVDLGRLVRPDRLVTSWFKKQTDWIPIRDPAALYQGDKVVGRAEGVSIDETSGVVVFKVISNSESMALQDTFIFRSYRLRPKTIGHLSGLSTAYPGKGQVLEDVVCEIVGRA